MAAIKNQSTFDSASPDTASVDTVTKTAQKTIFLQNALRFAFIAVFLTGAAQIFTRFVDIGTCDGTCLLFLLRSGSTMSITSFLAGDDRNTLDEANAWPRSVLCSTNSGKAKNTKRMPRVIHQSWSSKNLPSRFAQWSAKWKALNPGWQHILWTDDANRNLVIEKYPWLLRAYDALPLHMMRVDLARLLYMHAFGGVYVDLDFIPLKPIEEVLTPSMLSKTPLVLAFLSHVAPNSTTMPHRHVVPNAWMASARLEHPFWMLAAAEAIRRAGAGVAVVEAVAGPITITDLACEAIKGCLHSTMAQIGTHDDAVVGDLRILRAGTVYPFDWTAPGNNWAFCSAQSRLFNATKCTEKFPDAHAVTFWAHSWNSSSSHESGRLSKLVISSIAFLEKLGFGTNALASAKNIQA